MRAFIGRCDLTIPPHRSSAQGALPVKRHVLARRAFIHPDAADQAVLAGSRHPPASVRFGWKADIQRCLLRAKAGEDFPARCRASNVYRVELPLRFAAFYEDSPPS